MEFLHSALRVAAKVLFIVAEKVRKSATRPVTVNHLPAAIVARFLTVSIVLRVTPQTPDEFYTTDVKYRRYLSNLNLNLRLNK